ncbi:lipopolysaccharide biosynthesis protein [Aureimonas jatrophae]|uniref:Membrane protein involved in the export of O-antigen and teichoic acid n=1 Tax=Aureimonas jatrophae TaxID=1166073 RepID=A0A1H0L3Q5_9HYPH|nr:lipopolysaccharide biosynthesis protein [Aureimonas jatrophae]MBB3952397.1 O-antigen/teichoic acid export membrane protein [Aureimonas jatrophae]SDO62848.1 Membrane protein involved in the export of O-antigen and teichoic acid [Aureimonas jatrophae]
MGSMMNPTLEGKLKLALDYAKLLGGSGGRLVLSLAYFAAIANALSVADYGLFATASATGIVLSRIFGLGFVSPLYRTSAARPRLIGVYTAGLLLAAAVSLPLVVLAAVAFYLAVFRGDVGPGPFALIVAAEVLAWRTLEVVCIVNNGLGRFGRSSLLVVGGTLAKALAALLFLALAGRDGGLWLWGLLYLCANTLSAMVGIALLYPRQRLRVDLRLYRRRLQDSLAVAGAEILFYLQSELDKLLVLSVGGPQTAGVYALLMRLIDLTALPVRSFNMMVVQKLMRTPDWLASWRMRLGLEGGIALVSAAGAGALALVLLFAPGLLGGNVAQAVPLMPLVILVPAFRNLVEYESELLYAGGRTTIRAGLLALLGAAKAALLTWLLRDAGDGSTTWVGGLNAVFALLWGLSFVSTYAALSETRRRPARLRTA